MSEAVHEDRQMSAAPDDTVMRPSRTRRVLRSRELILMPALIVLLILGALVHPAFLTPGNLVNILGSSAALALLVLAESLILITGKFDLSLESTAALAPAI